MTTLLAFLAALLAVGSIGFWIFSFAVFVIITALVESDEGAWATFVAVVTIAALQFLSKVPLLATVKIHPLATGLAVLSYFALGAGWSLFKWYLFLHKGTRRYDDAKAEFLEQLRVEQKLTTAPQFTGELAAKLFDKLEEHNRYANEREKIVAEVLARKHKSSLTRWATYWPFSMVGFALNDVVRKAWQYIYDLLQSTYQRISNHVFRNVAADAAMAQEYKAKQAAAGAGSSTDAPSPRNRRG